VFPGCTHNRYVDGHHIQHWAEGGLRIERTDDGVWRFFKPDGASIETCAPGHTRPLGDRAQLVAANLENGVTIDATTGATRWKGERMDYGIAIDSLLWRTKRGGGGVSAET
jgi:hypothetical protein